MPIGFNCQDCGASYRVKDELAGRAVRCKKCGATVRVPERPEPEAPAPAAPPLSTPAVAETPPKDVTSSGFGRLMTSARKAEAGAPLPRTMKANRVVAGRNCPACGEKLKLGEDVYNCESCQGSHHRACWDKTGACSDPECPSSSGPKVEVVEVDAEGRGLVAAAPGRGPGRPPRATEGAGPSSNKKFCPMCGEKIGRLAKRCPACGEVFDKSVAGGYAGDSDSKLSGWEWVLCILCSGIGCIVGIVYMIQGKPKGKIMLGVSLAVAFGWNLLRVLAAIATGT